MKYNQQKHATSSHSEYNFPLVEKSITVTEDSERNMCSVYIRGAIEDVTTYSEELVQLDKLSNKYDIVEVTINTPGGSLDTTVDLIQILKKFSLITTIGVSSVASAGTIIWGIGNVRVVSPYTTMMFHRESYGYYGKTVEHKAFAEISEKVNRKLFDDTVSSFLTEEELKEIEKTEVWLTGEEMIERGLAISMEKYNNPTPMTISKIYTIPDNNTGDEYTFAIHPETGHLQRFIQTWTNCIVEDTSRYAYGIDEFNYLDSEETFEYDLINVNPYDLDVTEE